MTATAAQTATTRLWDDTVLPFQLDASDIRGRVARLDGVLDRVLEQHDYPPAIEALVAEMALLTALIGQTVKLRWKLSLQVRGDGPARLIATDYYAPEEDGAPARIRAYASYDAERLAGIEEAGDIHPFELIGKGYFAILIDQGPDMVPYQGITPIAGGSLADCAQTYFAQSEQIPTRFALAYGRSALAGGAEGWRGGAVMLQHMPKAGMHVTGPDDGRGGSGEGGLLTAEDVSDEDAAEDWNRVNVLLDTTEELELVGPSVAPADLLVRLFHEEGPRVFDSQPVRFGCSCSGDKVRQSLSIYSAKDIATMTTDAGVVTADCQFCGAHYEFDPATLGFEATAAPHDA
jgi:molecular chaperone Hsp33